MDPYLSIFVGENSTIINYVFDNEVLVTHTHPVGFKHIENDGMNIIAGSKLLDGVLYILEFISLHDRIPTNFKLISPRYATWVGDVFKNGSYTQFYTNSRPINVTIEVTKDNQLSYARHSQTLHSFKV